MSTQNVVDIKSRFVPPSKIPQDEHIILGVSNAEAKRQLMAMLEHTGTTDYICKLDAHQDRYCFASRKLVKGCTAVAVSHPDGSCKALVKAKKPPTDAQGRLQVAKPQSNDIKALFARVAALESANETLRAALIELHGTITTEKSFKAVREALADTPVAEMEVA